MLIRYKDGKIVPVTGMSYSITGERALSLWDMTMGFSNIYVLPEHRLDMDTINPRELEFEFDEFE